MDMTKQKVDNSAEEQEKDVADWENIPKTKAAYLHTGGGLTWRLRRKKGK